jgi:hypothetical protein
MGLKGISQNPRLSGVGSERLKSRYRAAKVGDRKKDKQPDTDQSIQAATHYTTTGAV